MAGGGTRPLVEPVHDAGVECRAHGACPVLDLELSVDACEVELHGLLTEIQMRGYLLVRKTPREHLQHLNLSRGQDALRIWFAGMSDDAVETVVDSPAHCLAQVI